MFIGIVILILGLTLLIIDGLISPRLLGIPPWYLLSAIRNWLNNRIVRRILRILSVLAITIGGLFIISSIGFVAQSIRGLSEGAKNGLMWLTLMPVFIAGIVVWIALISGAALERAARGFARLLGFNTVQQATLEAWEKSFLAVMFWVYIMLSLYPVYNPWTGSPKMFLFICGFALALATYARWAAMKGKGPKLFAIVMVPLFFLYCLGKQQPNAYPTLGSLVRWSEAIGSRENAKRDLGSAVKNQQTSFYRDGEEIIKNNTYAFLKSDVIALDQDLNQIVLEGGYKENVKILRKLAVADLSPKLKAYFIGSTESFYEIQFMDELGKYSIKSKIGYIETSGVKGIINIPEAPEVKNLSSSKQEFEARLSDGNYVKFDPRPALKLDEGTVVRVSGPREYKWGFDIKENATMPIGITALAPRGAETIYIRGPRVTGNSHKFKITIGD